MITDELLDFLRAQIAVGATRESLEQMLLTQGGWEKSDLDEAFRVLETPTPETTHVAEVFSQNVAVPPVQNSAPVATEVPVVDTPVVLEVRSERPTDVRNEPIQAPVTLPATVGGTDHNVDDFLGIFQSTSTSPAVVAVSPKPEIVEHAESPATLATPATPASHVITFEPISLLQQGKQVLPAQEPTIETKTPTDNSEATQSSPLQQMLVGATPTVTRVDQPIPSESPAPTIVEHAKSESVPAEPATPGFHFNIAKLRKEEPAPIEVAPPAIEAPLPTLATKVLVPAEETTATQYDAIKPIETKSVEELWLENKGTPVAQTEITGRRTMMSDILLRGKGAAIQGLPSISVPEDSSSAMRTLGQANKQAYPGMEISEEGHPLAPQSTSGAAVPPLQAMHPVMERPVAEPQDPARKQKIKRVLGLTLGVLVTLAVFGGVAYLYFIMRGPGAETTFSAAFSQFTSATSFTYSGTASSSLKLSTATDGLQRDGTVEFLAAFAGQLKSDKSGYGDGNHRAKFIGGLQSGAFKWSTDVESDIRMVANELYFHVSSFPTNAGIDPDVFKTYWIKIDLDEIAKELALSGVALSGQGYGNFGSGSESTVFTALLTKHSPFRVIEKIDDGSEDTGTLHLKLEADPERMLQFMSALYAKYTGKGLTLDSNQELRLKDALAKITAEVWIDATTNALQKFSADVNFDDDIVGMRVKGPIHLDVAFSNYNAQVSAVLPTPILTLEELQSRMSDYEKVKETRSRDTAKYDTLVIIQSALANYMREKGRYPTVLSELRTAGKLATSTVDDIRLKRYIYAPYVSPDAFSKANKCTTKVKSCTQYHIGINFEDVTHPLLQNDSDQISDVYGNDETGCGKESNMACYDALFPMGVDDSR